MIIDNGWVDIEELLSAGKIIQIFPRGYSMYPLFVPGRDAAVIAPVTDRVLKRGDIVLFRRKESILVLHRIWKVKPEGLYLVGDNQSVLEGPVTSDDVRGVVVTIVHNGRYFSTENIPYVILSRTWLALRPFRPVISRFLAKIKKIIIK